MKWIGVLGVMVIFGAGCNVSQPDSLGAERSWEANYGKWVHDPVLGGLIPRRIAVERQYEGKTYYFRDEAEAKKFEANPSAYVTAQVSEDSVAPVVHRPTVHSR